MKKTWISLILTFLTWNFLFANFEEAKELYNNKNYNEALSILNQLIEDKKANLEIYKMVMEIYKEKKHQESYLAATKQYIRAGGRINYDSAWALGNYAHQVKKYNDVVIFSKICLTLSPNNHSIYNLMGVAYYYLKKHQLSVVALKSAVTLSAGEPIYTANLARSYESLEDRANAIKYYKLALKNDPQFQRASTALRRLGAK